MTIRFYVTVVLIIAISLINAVINHMTYIEKVRNLLSMAAVVIIAIIGGWDRWAIILSLVTYVSSCYFILVIMEGNLPAAFVGALILGAVVIFLIVPLEPVEHSKETFYENRINLDLVDDYFIKTSVDGNTLYYIYYVQTDGGIEADKVVSTDAKVLYDKGDEAYLEREYADISYINYHFGGISYKEKHVFQGYVIHIPEGRIR